MLALAVVSPSLLLSAPSEFTPNVVSVELQGRKVPDPEFDSQDHQMTWQDDRSLWVADIDPDSGDISISSALLLASNCAPMFPMEGTTVHGNGPEWMYTAEGSKILYTISGAHEAGWSIGVAEKTGSGWEAGTPLALADEVGGVPDATKVDGDADPMLYFYADSTTQRKTVHVRSLNDSDFGVVIPFDTKSPPRWTLQGHQLITAQKIGSTIQAVLFDPENGGSVEQLTFDKKFHKDELFIWQAPEFGNDSVFLVAECKRQGGEASQLGIYRKVNARWERVKTVLPPAGRKFKFPHSPEPFVFEGRSYVVLSLKTKRGNKDGTEIWIAGIGSDNFYRRIAGPEHGIISSDPETYVGTDTVYVYLAQRGGQQLFRADTGL